MLAQLDHVVPVAAHLELVPPGQVADGHVQTLDLRQPAGEHALLERDRDLVLALVDHPPLEGQRDAIAGQGHQLEVVAGEGVDLDRADVHHAEHASLDGERHTDQRAARLAQVVADDLFL